MSQDRPLQNEAVAPEPETWAEAIRLYRLGQISSGRAAELAGMSRVEFLLALDRCKVFPLEDELRDLEASNG